MVLPKTEEGAPSEVTPEVSSPPSPGDGAVVEGEGAPAEETAPELTPEQAKDQLREMAGTPEFVERFKALREVLPEETFDAVFGEEIDRKAQSRTDRATRSHELDKEIASANEWAQDELGKAVSGVDSWSTEGVFAKDKAIDGLRDYGKLAGQYVSRVRELQVDHALASHDTHRRLTDDDRNKLASVKNEPDPAVALGQRLKVYLDRAYQAGVKDSPQAAKVKADEETKLADKFGPLMAYLTGGAAAPSVTTKGAGAPGKSFGDMVPQEKDAETQRFLRGE